MIQPYFSRRFSIFLVAVCASQANVLLSLAGDAKPQALQPSAARGVKAISGRLETIGDLKTLTLWGTPQERGFAHGKLLGDEIKQTIVQYLRDTSISGGANVYEKTVAYYAKPIMTSDPRIDEELRGMLDGMRDALGGDRGLMLDMLKRPLDIRDLRAIQFASDAAPRGCSSFAAWGHFTPDGKVMAGRNLDWFAADCVTGHGVVIVYAADPAAGRLGWVSLTWPGAIGCYTAMNEEGVTLAIHDVANRSMVPSAGVSPRPLVLRAAIEQAHAAVAVEDVTDILRSHRVLIGTNVGLNMPMTAAPTPAAVFEFDGRGDLGAAVTVRGPDVGHQLLVCTNHYRKRLPAGTAELKDYDKGSCWRYDNLLTGVIDAQEGRLKLDVEGAWKLLESVSMDGRNSNQVLTLQSVLFEPDSLRMHVAFGRAGVPAAKQKPTMLDVKKLLGDARAK